MFYQNSSKYLKIQSNKDFNFLFSFRITKHIKEIVFKKIENNRDIKLQTSKDNDIWNSNVAQN